MLHQIIYVSNRACSDQDIEKILQTARAHNASNNITGLMLYTDTKFVQLIEGEKEVIEKLYSKINVDKRHTTPYVISTDLIRERAFPSWQMASKRIGSSEVNYVTNILPTEKTVFENILAGNKENGFFVLELMKRFFYV